MTTRAGLRSLQNTPRVPKPTEEGDGYRVFIDRNRYKYYFTENINTSDVENTVNYQRIIIGGTEYDGSFWNMKENVLIKDQILKGGSSENAIFLFEKITSTDAQLSKTAIISYSISSDPVHSGDSESSSSALLETSIVSESISHSSDYVNTKTAELEEITLSDVITTAEDSEEFSISNLITVHEGESTKALEVFVPDGPSEDYPGKTQRTYHIPEGITTDDSWSLGEERINAESTSTSDSISATETTDFVIGDAASAITSCATIVSIELDVDPSIYKSINTAFLDISLTKALYKTTNTSFIDILITKAIYKSSVVAV